jgi:hypothetical protein
MGDHTGGHELDREAVSYYKLGNLLRKERSELKARLVQAVTHENIPVEEKIARINAIDLKPEEGETPPARHIRHLDHPIVAKRATAESGTHRPRQEPKEPKEPPAGEPAVQASAEAGAGEAAGSRPASGQVAGSADAKAPAPRDPAVGLEPNERRDIKARFAGDASLAHPAVQQAARARQRALREPGQGGFINYLISDLWKIKRFGLSSRTLESAGWPFSLHFTPAVPVFMQQTLKGEGLENLREVLAPTLRKGWMFLDKQEYNLLAALQQLAGAAQRMECRTVKGRPEPVLASLSAAGSLVQVLNLLPGMPQRACVLLGKVCERTGISEQDRVKAEATIRQLLDLRDSGLTLPNLVRAAWMRHTHRFLENTDLGLAGEPGRYFSDAAFDCSLEVQQDIDRHIAQQVGRLDHLDVERLDIARWRCFLPAPPADAKTVGRIDDARRPALEKVDLGALIGFYQGHPAHSDYVFMVDRSTPLLLLARFLDLFLATFMPLMATGVRTGGQRQEILQRSLLAAQVAKLGFLHERLQEAVVAMPHLGALKYADLMGGSASGSDAEKLLVARIKELAAALVATGKTMADVIKNRSALAPPVMRGGLMDLPAYPLPAENQAIQSADSLNGVAVFDALALAARVALQAGFYIAEGELDITIGREAELAGQLQPVLEGLERLASAEQLAFLRSAYPAILGV